MLSSFDPEKIKNKEFISEGGFGKVYKIDYEGEKYAMKQEIKEKTKVPQLEYEFNVYLELMSKGMSGIPIIISYFETKNMDKFLVMKLYGPSLQQLNNQHKITQDDVKGWIFPQSFQILKDLHKNGFLHRDLKPDNFLTEPENPKKLVLTDFGLCKKFMQNGKKHINFNTEKPISGTIRYNSIASHQGKEQSRRDDLESLGYVMVFLWKQNLPWILTDKLPATATKEEKVKLITKTKMSTSVEELCQDLPQEFKTYFKHVRNLKFTQSPDYCTLEVLINKLEIKN